MNFVILICILVTIFSCIDQSIQSKCSTCEGIVDKFKEGLKKTAKSNFGGGNTRWEEKSLGSYAFSETRLLEILEDACSGNECHTMLEHQEENIEAWWFQHYAKKKDTELRTYICVERVKGGCCQKGKWGPVCTECPGGSENPCKGEGTCDGDGTKDGTGKCNCNFGYKGDSCDECTEDYYVESKADDKIICKACHQSCKSGCTAPEPDGCNDCKEGWVDTDDKGCQDVNECEGNPCAESEYCINTEGSYDCSICHIGCIGCTGIGADKCKECSETYYKDGEYCNACHESCEKSCRNGTPQGCEACKEGWEWNDEQGCVDKNECETETCADNQYCVNTQGSFRCATCNSACDGCTGPDDNSCKKCSEGYQLAEDGRCTDKDECDNPNACGKNEVCTNQPGSFTCDCKEDFYRKSEGCVPKPKDPAPKKKKVITTPSGPYKGPADCGTCKEIVENIFKGIEATSKHNFGGGNTRWEEEKLGPWAYSETRLTEVLEQVCGDMSSTPGKKILKDYDVDDDKVTRCAHMLERYEDNLEKWWLKSFAKNKDKDLFLWLCINTAEICCPSGTSGKDCSPCTGGVSRPCTGNGKCQGEGTREGTGSCTCDAGYTGNACDSCTDNHYQVSKNETHIVCKECDPSCTSDGCDADGPTGCHNCKDGYTHDDIQGCVDNDECAGTSPCSEDEYCLNTPGSYACNKCDYSCKGCRTSGSDNCLKCKERYYTDSDDNRCKACDRACKTGCTGPNREHCTGECRFGYEFIDGQGCQDLNECENGKHNCPEEEKYCENTMGHFNCRKCDDACSGGCTSSGPENCKSCKDGYSKAATGDCVDIDECLMKIASCDAEKKKCVNTSGSYNCDCEDGLIEKDGKCIVNAQEDASKIKDQNKSEKEEL